MLLNAMYGGLGQSMGALIGGKLQSKYGTVKTFLYSGAADLCFVVLVVMYLNIRKASNFRNPQPIVPAAEYDIIDHPPEDMMNTTEEESDKTK